MSTPEKYCSFSNQPPASQEETDSTESDKERHSSGDSALSSSPPPPPLTSNKDITSINNHHVEGRPLAETLPTRGILKTSLNRGRSYSESNATDPSRLMESASMVSVDSSIPEEQEDDESCFMNGEYLQKHTYTLLVHCLFQIGVVQPCRHSPATSGDRKVFQKLYFSGKV
jgi:hypothetical protein